MVSDALRVSSWVPSTSCLLVSRDLLGVFLSNEEGLVTLLSLGRVLGLCSLVVNHSHGLEMDVLAVSLLAFGTLLFGADFSVVAEFSVGAEFSVATLTSPVYL